MTVQFLLATVIRWAGLAALATLVGSLVVDVLVLPREPSEVGAVRGRLRRVGVICLIVLAGTTAGELVTRAQTMAGGDLAAALPAMWYRRRPGRADSSASRSASSGRRATGRSPCSAGSCGASPGSPGCACWR